MKALNGIGDVFISVPRGKYTDKMVQMGCHFEELKIDRRGMNPLQEVRLIRDYVRLLNKVKPDIVLTYSIKPNVYLGYLCGRKGIPYIANVTGLGTSIQNKGISSKLTVLLYRIGLRKAGMVFCQNKSNRKFLLEQGVIKGRSELIPGSGVNLTAHCFEKYPPDTDELKFLTIGRIMKDKGTDELLEAARIVKRKHPAVSFSLIGFYDGDYQDKIEEAEKDGIVRFYGHQDDVHSFIKHSHAIIHPSYHEGMANALLESASAGRPVIATDVSGCIETYEPNITGFSCKPKDSIGLANAILRFIDTPYEEKVKMGIMARAKMEKEFNREIVINKYLGAIKEIRRE